MFNLKTLRVTSIFSRSGYIELILPSAGHFKQFIHPKMHNLLPMRQQLCLGKFHRMIIDYWQHMALFTTLSAVIKLIGIRVSFEIGWQKKCSLLFIIVEIVLIVCPGTSWCVVGKNSFARAMLHSKEFNTFKINLCLKSILSSNQFEKNSIRF